MRRLIWLGLALPLGWALLVGLVWWQRHALIYPFERSPAVPATPGIRVATLPAEGDAPALPVWLARPRDGRPWVVVFMGNAGSLALHEARLAEIVAAGYGLAAMAYRGGGGAPGRPREAALKADALRLWRGLDGLAGRPVAEDRRVIWGLSLGAAIGVWLAVRTAPRAVVLENPFSRLCAVARHHYPWLPACTLLADERYDSVDIVGAVAAPLLVLHGERDDIVPVAQGRALFAAARAPKTLRTYPAAGHNDLGEHGAVEDAFRFLEALPDG